MSSTLHGTVPLMAPVVIPSNREHQPSHLCDEWLWFKPRMNNPHPGPAEVTLLRAPGSHSQEDAACPPARSLPGSLPRPTAPAPSLHTAEGAAALCGHLVYLASFSQGKGLVYSRAYGQAQSLGLLKSRPLFPPAGLCLQAGFASLQGPLCPPPPPPPLQTQLLPTQPARPCEVTSSWLPGVWSHLRGVLCGCQGQFLFAHWAYSQGLARAAGRIKALFAPG